MTQYRLTKDSYLNDRYFTAGTVVEWDGPPNKAMEAINEDGEKKIKAHNEAIEKKPVVTEIPQEGGDPPDPTWAPDPRPAFSVKTKRKPDSKRGKDEPKSSDKEASITRNPTAPKK